MKPRNKIFAGVGAVFLVAVTTLAIALSHESDCPPAPTLAAGTESMRAITRRCYGSPGKVLVVEHIAKPVPTDEQVLIKVHASSVNPAEWHGVTGKPYLIRLDSGFGLPERVRVGFDYAGTVEAVGAKVTRFKPGDEVFGGAGGALAEYVVARETASIIPKPPQMTFDEAAAIPIAAITALQALRDQGRIAAGQKVLINGASGGVGTYAVQIAKAFGAEVTGVCSTRNVELVRSLGADRVIDYTKENFTEAAERYDLIIDNVGNHPFNDMRNVMTPEGTLVLVGGPKTDPWLGPISKVIKMKLLANFIDQRFTFFIASVNPADLTLLADLVREGKMRTVIDKRYPLEEAGAALDYIGSGRARGKVVITIAAAVEAQS
jgi:NADPH:quinone reductase-like Zn-dependent oxidoreductase